MNDENKLPQSPQSWDEVEMPELSPELRQMLDLQRLSISALALAFGLSPYLLHWRSTSTFSLYDFTPDAAPDAPDGTPQP